MKPTGPERLCRDTVVRRDQGSTAPTPPRRGTWYIVPSFEQISRRVGCDASGVLGSRYRNRHGMRTPIELGPPRTATLSQELFSKPRRAYIVYHCSGPSDGIPGVKRIPLPVALSFVSGNPRVLRRPRGEGNSEREYSEYRELGDGVRSLGAVVLVVELGRCTCQRRAMTRSFVYDGLVRAHDRVDKSNALDGDGRR